MTRNRILPVQGTSRPTQLENLEVHEVTIKLLNRALFCFAAVAVIASALGGWILWALVSQVKTQHANWVYLGVFALLAFLGAWGVASQRTAEQMQQSWMDTEE